MDTFRGGFHAIPKREKRVSLSSTLGEDKMDGPSSCVTKILNPNITNQFKEKVDRVIID